MGWSPHFWYIKAEMFEFGKRGLYRNELLVKLLRALFRCLCFRHHLKVSCENPSYITALIQVKHLCFYSSKFLVPTPLEHMFNIKGYQKGAKTH